MSVSKANNTQVDKQQCFRDQKRRYICPGSSFSLSLELIRVHSSSVSSLPWFDLCIRMDCKEIKPVHPKGNQSWIVIGRTDAEAEAPALWPFNGKSWLIGKYTDAGKDWGQEKKGVTEDEMVGWHHQLNGHEFEQTLGEGEGQGSLMCCSSWGHKEPEMT